MSNDHLLPPDATLAECQAWLRDRVDDGATCPCCTQFAKVYRRKINSGMARALLALYRQRITNGNKAYHLTSLAPWTHEGGQLAWWGLITQDPTRRDDGGQSGWWKITTLGQAFAQNRVEVPKYAKVFNRQLMELDDSVNVKIVDTLGTKFDYTELMAGL